MHDIKWIRNSKEEFDQSMVKRGLKPAADKVINLDEDKRQLVTLVQHLQHAKNEKAKLIALIKDKGSREFERNVKDCNDINSKLEELQKKLEVDDRLEVLLSTLPNVLAADVPLGKNEDSNQIIRSFGSAPRFTFKPKLHYELGESLGMMDFAQAAKISGSRFVLLKDQLAKLERALANFMLDMHTNEFNFTEISPPLLVKDSAMFGVGQLPKFADDSFQTTSGLRLIPTSEVSLANIVSDSIIPVENLPLRFVAFTPCFRLEAGSAGKDTRGMMRQHQFSKVELVSIATPEDAEQEHEMIVNSATKVLERLELPYRVMLLCSGETGFSAKKQYDIEVWLPGQNKYREISSCSNCGEFQARRMKARFRYKGQKETKFIHSLNGSALAVGRTMIAILENYQNEDGSIKVPTALQPYLGGLQVIGKK
jgi:seryl-tRNA synthetase